MQAKILSASGDVVSSISAANLSNAKSSNISLELPEDKRVRYGCAINATELTCELVK